MVWVRDRIRRRGRRYFDPPIRHFPRLIIKGMCNVTSCVPSRSRPESFCVMPCAEIKEFFFWTVNLERTGNWKREFRLDIDLTDLLVLFCRTRRMARITTMIPRFAGYSSCFSHALPPSFALEFNGTIHSWMVIDAKIIAEIVKIKRKLCHGCIANVPHLENLKIL